MRRRNFSKRCCPKCGGNIGVLKRDTSKPKRNRLDTLGCLSGIHMQDTSTVGYDLRHFPLRSNDDAARKA